MITLIAQPRSGRYNALFVQGTFEEPFRRMDFIHPLGNWYDLRVSPDKDYLLTTLAHGATTTYLIPLATGVPERLNSYFAADTVLAWLPDQRLLLQAQTYNAHLQPYGLLYTMQPDGNDKVFVSTGTVPPAARWTPTRHRLSFLTPTQYREFTLTHDGKQFAVVPWHREDTLVLCDSTTGYERPLFQHKQRVIRHPTWSPDATHIAFIAESQRGAADILYIVDVQTSSATAIIQTRHPELRWAWAPNSQAIAVSTWKRHREVLMVYDRQTQQLRDVANITGTVDTETNDYVPNIFAWSPAGTQLLYALQPQQQLHLKMVAIDSGHVQELPREFFSFTNIATLLWW